MPTGINRTEERRYILVLAGSGHPAPIDHPSYDMRPFDEFINDHIDKNNSEVLVDYRFYVYDEDFAKKVDHLNRVIRSAS